MDHERLAETIGLIYDTGLDASAWPFLLTGLARLFNAHFADSFQRTTDYSRFGGIAVGLDVDDYNDEFLGVWVKRNIWGTQRPVKRAGDVITTREMVPLASLLGSEMYNDYLAPRGLQEGLRLDIRAADGQVEDISILRTWSAGAYAATEIRAARLLVPHLQRASAISRRLALSESTAAASTAAIDGLPTAFVFLDRSQRVVFSNRAATTLLAEADGLVATREGLLGGRSESSVDALLTRAVGTRDRPGRSGTLQLERPSGKAALILLTIPLRSNTKSSHLVCSGEPVALVCIVDPLQRKPPRCDQLRALFGLTAAEAALAAALLGGEEVREIAERTGRSVNTVRTLLARLMAKTDTNRQSEVIRLLASLPHTC